MLCADNLRPAGYTTLGWKKVEPNDEGVIYWHIVNFTPDQPKHKTILAFREAFDIWQQAFDKVPPVGRYITFESTDDFRKADIRFFFMDPNRRQQAYTVSDGSQYLLTNNWPFDGPMGVLAHRPPNKHEIHFDESEQWSDIAKYKRHGNKYVLYVRLMAVVLHELGHMWDLGHSKVKQAVMFAQYSGDAVKIHPDDQNGLNKAWSSTKARVAHNLKLKAATAETDNDPGELITKALEFYGVKEVSGPESEPRIIEMIKKMFPSAYDDSKVAWCSIFINSIAQLAGYEHTNSAMAKSWLNVGKEIEWEDRQIGDVIIFNRTADPRFGHVAIYINDRDDERIRVLGGNQQDAVNIRSYAKSRIAGIRRLSKVS